jgi:hypothetical protein
MAEHFSRRADRKRRMEATILTLKAGGKAV